MGVGRGLHVSARGRCRRTANWIDKVFVYPVRRVLYANSQWLTVEFAGAAVMVGWGRQGHEEGMVSQGARTSLEHGRRTRLPLLWCRIEPWVLQAHGAAGRTDCRPNVVCVAEGKCSRGHCCRHCHLLILAVQSVCLYSLTHRNTSTEILQVSC